MFRFGYLSSFEFVWVEKLGVLILLLFDLDVVGFLGLVVGIALLCKIC